MKQWLKKFFIPSEENGYAPNSIEKRAAAVMLMLVLATFSLANIHSIVVISSDWFISSILPAVLVDMTNESRAGGDLSRLTRSDVLDHAATLKAQDMAENEYFAHESPTGVSPWHWFQEVGYSYAYAGENLAVNFTDSDAVVTAWMHSPGHRANIMKEQYTEIGIGTARGTYKGASTVFVVQLFGTQLSAVSPRTVVTPMVTESATVTSSSSVLAASTPTDATPTSTAPVGAEVVENNVPVRTRAKETPVRSISNKNEVLGDNSVAEDSALETMTSENREEEGIQSAPAVILAQNPDALFSDMATTSNSGLENGSFVAVGSAAPPQQNVGGGWMLRLWRLFATPHTVMTYLYFIFALYVFVTLMISIIIEWRHQNPIQLAYGVGLMAVMLVMLYVHLELTSGALVV